MATADRPDEANKIMSLDVRGLAANNLSDVPCWCCSFNVIINVASRPHREQVMVDEWNKPWTFTQDTGFCFPVELMSYIGDFLNLVHLLFLVPFFIFICSFLFFCYFSSNSDIRLCGGKQLIIANMYLSIRMNRPITLEKKYLCHMLDYIPVCNIFVLFKTRAAANISYY